MTWWCIVDPCVNKGRRKISGCLKAASLEKSRTISGWDEEFLKAGWYVSLGHEDLLSWESISEAVASWKPKEMLLLLQAPGAAVAPFGQMEAWVRWAAETSNRKWRAACSTTWDRKQCWMDSQWMNRCQYLHKGAAVPFGTSPSPYTGLYGGLCLLLSGSGKIPQQLSIWWQHATYLWILIKALQNLF